MLEMLSELRTEVQKYLNDNAEDFKEFDCVEEVFYEVCDRIIRATDYRLLPFGKTFRIIREECRIWCRDNGFKSF